MPKSQRLQSPGQGLVALVGELNLRADPVRAVPMAAYMRNKFPFLGISAPDRRRVVTDSFPTGTSICESEVGEPRST
ncbi:MAG: DNA alkylation repair protein [Candidatus Nanopelagicales bacterium]